MVPDFTFVILLFLVKSTALSIEKSENDIQFLKTNEFVNYSSPVVSLDLEGSNVNFYNVWAPWSFNTNYYNRREDAHIYSNDNTKYILEGLAAFAAVGAISQNRSRSTFNGKVYYHGQRFYPGNTSKDGVSCVYKPKFLYFANYEDKQPVDGIYFDCTKKQYCSELECFSTTLWWISLCVVIPLFVIFTVCGIVCRCYTR